MSGGTFNVSRRIWKNPVFKPTKFSDREAFIWLVSEASWKPRTIRDKTFVINLERGQLSHSLRWMAGKWGWKHDAVKRYLVRLENHDMISVSSATGQNILTICKYNEYQADVSGGATDNATAPATAPRQHRDKEEERLNKGKKDKKISFDIFWNIWPNKVSKQTAVKAWDKLPEKDQLIIVGLPSGGYESWQRSAPNANPIHPATFLNNRRWEDTPIINGVQNGQPNNTKTNTTMGHDAFAELVAETARAR